MADNVINISGFNDENEALDGNNNRIVIVNGEVTHVLKPDELTVPDKVVAVVTIIND